MVAVGNHAGADQRPAKCFVGQDAILFVVWIGDFPPTLPGLPRFVILRSSKVFLGTISVGLRFGLTEPNCDYCALIVQF